MLVINPEKGRITGLLFRAWDTAAFRRIVTYAILDDGNYVCPFSHMYVLLWRRDLAMDF